MYALSMTKSRLSVTVDADLVAVVHAAVAAGAADSMSAWVSDALRLKLDHDRRLRGIDDFIAAYEAEHGEITEEEMEAAERWPGSARLWSGAARSCETAWPMASGREQSDA